MKKRKIKKVQPVATSDKKSTQKKWWVAGIGLASAGVLGYFSWQYYQKQKTAKNAASFTPVNWPDIQPSNNSNPPLPVPAPVYKPQPQPVYQRPPKPASNNTPKDTFPLKRGSRGENVRAFQQALLDAYGKKALPRYGADGQFGNEMAAALITLKLSPTIDETTFNILVKQKAGGNSSGGSGSTIAQQLITAAAKKDFAAAIKSLKLIADTDQYTTVGNEFKTLRIGGGVRQTLVNGMLNSFADETQKRAIRLEFQRMGLQYDGSKWTLSGMDGLNGLAIVTIAATTVWLNASQSVQVPARTVLGNEISRRLDYTLFESKGKHYLVQTACVTYL